MLLSNLITISYFWSDQRNLHGIKGNYTSYWTTLGWRWGHKHAHSVVKVSTTWAASLHFVSYRSQLELRKVSKRYNTQLRYRFFGHFSDCVTFINVSFQGLQNQPCRWTKSCKRESSCNLISTKKWRRQLEFSKKRQYVRHNCYYLEPMGNSPLILMSVTAMWDAFYYKNKMTQFWSLLPTGQGHFVPQNNVMKRFTRDVYQWYG